MYIRVVGSTKTSAADWHSSYVNRAPGIDARITAGRALGWREDVMHVGIGVMAYEFWNPGKV